MNDLEQQTSYVRSLGQQIATAERRAEVMAALGSKWEGVQSVALDALGHWGGSDSLTALRCFLEEAFGRDAGWAIRGVAIRNLIPMVTAEDAEWVLDMYFKRPTALEKHELLQLVLALPPESARARLVAELASPDPVNRQAAVKAIGNMRYPDRVLLIRPLRDDLDHRVRSSAKVLSQDRTPDRVTRRRQRRKSRAATAYVPRLPSGTPPS